MPKIFSIIMQKPVEPVCASMNHIYIYLCFFLSFFIRSLKLDRIAIGIVCVTSMESNKYSKSITILMFDTIKFISRTNNQNSSHNHHVFFFHLLCSNSNLIVKNVKFEYEFERDFLSMRFHYFRHWVIKMILVDHYKMHTFVSKAEMYTSKIAIHILD